MSSQDQFNPAKIQWPKCDELTELDHKISELAQKYAPDAIELLREIVRIPADFCDKDPLCGTSNHEGPRLEYLKDKIIEYMVAGDTEKGQILAKAYQIIQEEKSGEV